MLKVALRAESDWIALYPPPVTVTDPVTVPALPVAETVMATAWLMVMVVGEAWSAKVAVLVPAVETQALTTLATLSEPRPVARS